MGKNNLKYFVTTAFKSIFKNALMSFISAFTVIACLLILGLFLALGINVNAISQQIRSDAEIKVVIDETYEDSKLAEMTAKIQGVENVASLSLVTKEDALDYMRDAFGEDQSVLDGLEEDNPFRTPYNVTLKDITQAADTAAQLRKIEGIAEVNNKQELLDKIVYITDIIRTASVWVMILLCIVSVFIIANTIKLAVYARRKEIGIMKFVGATDWFVRWPFIIEGILIGLIGGVIAFGLISWGYIACIDLLNTMELGIFTFIPYNEVAFLFLGAFLGLGALIGALGSAFSMRKYLDV